MGASLVTQMVKHLTTMWETRVQSLGREDPLEKEMATHSSILAWKIPWTEEPGRLQSLGSQRVGHNWVTSLSFQAYMGASQGALVVKNLPTNSGDITDMGSTPGSGRTPRGGHGNPLQYSCLENSMGISHHYMGNRRGKVGAVTDFISLGSKITADSDCSTKLKDASSLEEQLWQT